MPAPTSIDRGHPSIHWPAGADKDSYRALAGDGFRSDDLAKAMAQIDAGSKFFRAVPHEPHGYAIVCEGDPGRRAA